MSHEYQTEDPAAGYSADDFGQSVYQEYAPVDYIDQMQYLEAVPESRACVEADSGFNINDLILEWIAEPSKINYSQLRAIEIPDLERTEHTLYHRALHAFYTPYRTQFYDGKTITPTEHVRSLAQAMCRELESPSLIPSGGGDKAKSYYEYLFRGKLHHLAVSLQKYTPEGLRAEIQAAHAGCTDTRPDEVIVEYLSMILQIGIIVIDAHKQDVCAMECTSSMRRFENTIVLLFHRRNRTTGEPAYYSCVALLPSGAEELDPDEVTEYTSTLFSTKHSFITALYERAEVVTKKFKQILNQR